MKVEVIKVFKDKEAGDIKRIGQEYITNKDRFAEINTHSEGPFLKNLDDEESKNTDDDESSGDGDVEDD